jgi:adenylate kinase family enzyme
MQRVMIIGQPGAGKSTLARQVADRLGLPVVHIDHIHWQAGWVERSFAEKTRMCLEAEAGAAWVFEGGHSATWDNRMARADMVIWLDRTVALRLWRVVKRAVLYWGRRRSDMPDGCVERFGPESLPFWAYIWRTRKTGRAGIARLMAQVPGGKRAVHLHSNAEVAAFLNSLRK